MSSLLVVLALGMISALIAMAYRSKEDAKLTPPSTSKDFSQRNENNKKDLKTDWAAKVNEFIKDKTCSICNTNEIPKYKIDSYNNEAISCCCERFAIDLQNEINCNLFHDNDICFQTNALTQTKPSSPFSRFIESSKYRTDIFAQIDISKLGETPIEQAIKSYEHPIVACYIGSLENKHKYALIIGMSDEWVNVITHNWAKNPTYHAYGFNVIEQRWSYGSKILGAQQIRNTINGSLSEIVRIMSTQEEARQEKKRAKELRQIEEEKAIQEEIDRGKREKELVKNTWKIFDPIINKNFTGLKFDLNQKSTKCRQSLLVSCRGYFAPNVSKSLQLQV